MSFMQTKLRLVNRDLQPTTMYRIQDSPPCHVFRRMALLGFLGAERSRSSITPFQSSALALAFGKPCLLCSLAHLCMHVSHVVPLDLSTLFNIPIQALRLDWLRHDGKFLFCMMQSSLCR